MPLCSFDYHLVLMQDAFNLSKLKESAQIFLSKNQLSKPFLHADDLLLNLNRFRKGSFKVNLKSCVRPGLYIKLPYDVRAFPFVYLNVYYLYFLAFKPVYVVLDQANCPNIKKCKSPLPEER